MHSLPLSTVPKWKNVANKWCPVSVDTLCPHCGRMVNLPLARHNHDGVRNTIAADAVCPGCGKRARFWVIDPGDAQDSSKRGCKYLGVFPAPRLERAPIVDADLIAEPALARVYQSACDAYNAGIWDACATSCRKTLEGLVHTLLPEENRKGSLFDQLKMLPQKVDLSKPLTVLANTLRKGGNIGAHFDLEKVPDQHVAELMLDLLDYFMEYIYVLDERSKLLEKQLEALGSKDE